MNMELLQRSTGGIRDRWPAARPACGLILGSGWGEALKGFERVESLPYSDIAAMGATTVAGHAGALHWGRFDGVEAFVFQGRRHVYEGCGWDPIAFPLHLLKSCGVRQVLLTNAAGGIRIDWVPGTLMLITDHINAMHANPLTGAHDAAWGPRFPDMSEVYDLRLRKVMRKAADALGVPLKEGVYLAVSGPSYETPAEVRAFRSWGADAVGMSTVPEAVLAHAAGLRVAGLSCITNPAASGGGAPLAHEEVRRVGERLMPVMGRLIERFVSGLAESDNVSRHGEAS